jgi:hypothetical protein
MTRNVQNLENESDYFAGEPVYIGLKSVRSSDSHGSDLPVDDRQFFIVQSC